MSHGTSERILKTCADISVKARELAFFFYLDTIINNGWFPVKKSIDVDMG